ncbi:MAG: T9SS type A sorting domain-containing protein [Cytophagales bacterium]|nr:T9SS type A sorting domain-containing protein [Cytophagales bacterium]
MARTQAGTPVLLPFWDDFASSEVLLQQTLWFAGNSVSLNNGIGIRPPSKNVVSFDGADSLGKPYNVNDVLAKGYADRLISQPIRMDLVDPALRSSVYISFFFQVQGRGEPPDNGDQLILSIKDQNGVWNNIHVQEPGPSLQPTLFYQVILPISDPKYFHNNFQFRFSNFARLSGPYDTWNVDYIYLNSGRSPSDIYYPDRTVSTSLTSLFQVYFSMPVKHFLEDPAGNLKKPKVDLFNLKRFDIPSGAPHAQPINYTTTAKITKKVGTTVTTALVKLDSAADPGDVLRGLEYLTVTLNKVPTVASFDPLSDSIHIRLKYGMATKDNDFSVTGDYDPAKYSPIDFRYSDTLVANYTLSSYYAYDDGTAEYGAGLNQAGSFLAFLFNMRTNNPDTISYVDIYFPEFGDNTSQSLQLQIRTNLTDNISALLFEQNIVVERKTKNRFKRYPLFRAVPVNGPFYIGWKQLTNASIPVGLDKNTDNGDKIFYNTNGLWIQNTTVKGSIMVRPGFGKGLGGVITGAEHKPLARIYPNPSRGICYLQSIPESLIIYDMTGRILDADVQQTGNETRITFPAAVSGLVILQYIDQGRRVTQKVMVRQE